MQRHLLLGTAGHIDHGKTSLIRALTGVDTDRLPEEKRRGITVDLGFASLQLEGTLLGIIDVPGHERFVKNMLAGALGIDLALLVVAADEGVMPQTREHFEALSYLNLSTGVIAITKCDLVEPAMLDLVEEEIAELVVGSFLQDSSIVHVSTKTEAGLEDLRTQLSEAARQVPDQRTDGPFKLSIDRCFSVSGQGTVVTGSVVSGSCEVGDSLQLLPRNEIVTVRKIESHGEAFESIGMGQRGAINLAGVHFSAIQRGDVLSTPGSIASSKMLSVQLSASRFATRPVKNLTGIRFYSGATETSGRVRLLEAEKLPVGETQLAQIELEDPVSTNWGEPFVIRGLAANEVLGGGQLVDPCAFRLSHRDLGKIEKLRTLSEGNSSQRIAALVALIGASSWGIEELWQRAGIADAQPIISELVAAGELCEFECKGKPRWLHRTNVEKLCERLLSVLEKEHQRDHLNPLVPLGRLKQFFQALQPTELLLRLAEQLHAQGRVRMDGELVALADWRPQLSANQSALLDQLVATCRQAEFTVPSVGEFAEQFHLTSDEVESLLRVAASNGDLVRMPDKDSRDAKASQRARLYLHRDAADALRDQVSTAFSANDPWTVSQFAEALGLSRKYAIPLCGYLDQTGVTARQGDLRHLVSADSLTS